MALSGTECLAAVFPASDIFPCSQSDVERSHLYSVAGCGSRCARLQRSHWGLAYSRQDLGFPQWLVRNAEDHCSGLQIGVFQCRNLPNETSTKTGKILEITDRGVCSVPLSTTRACSSSWITTCCLRYFSKVNWKKPELFFLWWLRKVYFLLSVRSNYKQLWNLLFSLLGR